MSRRLLWLCPVLVSLVQQSSCTTTNYNATFLPAINANRYALSLGKSSSASSQPCAKNLGNLTWDDGLASTAQTWAETCQYWENPNRDSDYQTAGGNTTVSESIWYDSSGSGNAVDSVATWWAQNLNFTYGTGAADNMTYTGTCSSTCADYKKMVNHNGTAVGCGVHTCSTLSASGGSDLGTNVQYVVCNYSPRYLPTSAPYSTGTTGSCAAPVTPTPTPSPTPVTPTPTPAGTSYFVASQVKLVGVSAAQFGLSTIQTGFKNTVAQNAGTGYTSADVTIVSYNDTSRRTGALKVTSHLRTASQAAANAASATLTTFMNNATAFTAALKSNGMSTVTGTAVLQAPTVGVETSSSSSSSGLSTGAIVGIVVGVVVAVVIAVVAVVMVMKQKKTKNQDNMMQASGIQASANPVHDSGTIGTVPAKSTNELDNVHGQI